MLNTFRNRSTFSILLFALLMVMPTVVPEHWACLSGAHAQDGSGQGGSSRAQSSSTAARGEDREAIEAAWQSFVRAFQAADATALAAHWTDGGEYVNESGVEIHGREAIESSFAAYFAETPEPQAEPQPESLRFLSDDSAISEGTVGVRKGVLDPSREARFTAIFVKEGDSWRIAWLSEVSQDTVNIEDLAWLIGQWQSASGEAADIRTTYTWDPARKFIRVEFEIKDNALGFGGTQVIGVDPATGGIRSWTFEAGGGIGEADWYRDGDHWVLDAAGTLPDGRTLMETNVLRRVDDSTFTWQSIDRQLGDTALPDLAPVRVTRIQPAE